MATDLRNLPAHLADDAQFRTWGSGLAAQLAVIGLIKTSDSGQINWGTVTRPGSSNTYAGYEIWRFADVLQATKPGFIKIEYGVAAATERPALRTTTGTGTDGAGTLTGQVGATYTLGATTTPGAATTRPSYCSGSPDRLSLVTNLDTSSTGYFMVLLVERTRDGSGTPTGDAIITVRYSLNSTLKFQLVPFTGAIPAATDYNPALDLNWGGRSLVGADVLLSPTVVFYGKARFASWCVYRGSDLITGLASIPVNHLNATRTYMPLGIGTAHKDYFLWDETPHSTDTLLATLWE